MVDSATRLFEMLPRLRRFLITSQSDPDGDSIGAQLALRQILLWHLKRLDATDATIEIVNEVACPHMYSFLPEADLIRTPETLTGRSFEIGFVLDCGVDRAGKAAPLFSACGERVWIDHHRFTLDGDYTIRLVDPDASSTCEVVYQNLVEHEAWRTPLDARLAERLYAGIIYDTGLFRHSLTRPKTHEIAARLVATGFDFSYVAQRIFQTRTFASRRILGRALASLRGNEDGTVAWTTLRQSDLRAEGANEDDCEDVIGQVTAVEGIEVAILFRETHDGRTKVSLRSKGPVNVGGLATSLSSGGGGHSRAAGCTLKGTIEEAARKVVPAAEEAVRVARLQASREAKADRTST